MKCAKHNAEIYGVEKKIVFQTGDCFDIIKRFMGKNNIVIFGSPPWGGKTFPESSIGVVLTRTRYGIQRRQRV